MIGGYQREQMWVEMSDPDPESHVVGSTPYKVMVWPEQ
jgi:hypothetical protein